MRFENPPVEFTVEYDPDVIDRLVEGCVNHETLSLHFPDGSQHTFEGLCVNLREYDEPTTWWQRFKDQHFPSLLKRWFPIQYHRVLAFDFETAKPPPLFDENGLIDVLTRSHLDTDGGYPYDWVWIAGYLVIAAVNGDGSGELWVFADTDVAAWIGRVEQALAKDEDELVIPTVWEEMPSTVNDSPELSAKRATYQVNRNDG